MGYTPDAANPDESHALQSGLWEVGLLCKHVDPDLAACGEFVAKGLVNHTGEGKRL